MIKQILVSNFKKLGKLFTIKTYAMPWETDSWNKKVCSVINV